MKHYTILLALLLGASLVFAQKNYKIGCIGFYNFENLFDTEDDPKTLDDEFTPTGKKVYTTAIYQEKLSHLADVVAQLGKEKTPDGVSILGVAEIENRKVLEDFIRQEKIADRNYQIIHYDSPDQRGIDVALLYQPKYFTVTSSRAVPLLIYRSDSSRIFTRDILFVSGLYDGEPLHILVNHWPSRSGGEKATRAYRNAGARVCKDLIDSLQADNPAAKIILMGDLNDDPVSPSVRQVLQARSSVEGLKNQRLYNPMEAFFHNGIGTLAYQDAWSLFDQLILSGGLVNDRTGFRFYQAQVFNPKFLVQTSGQFKGYPFRTFSGDTYIGGYSDHFPVYLFLLKEI